MNNDHKRMIVDLAKARTETVHKQRLESIKDLNSEWATHLDERKEEFATVSFLQRGIKRCGKVTSNGVESINGALLKERESPVVELIVGVVECQQQKCHERLEVGKTWLNEHKTLTAHALAQEAWIGDVATTKRVQMLESNHPVFRGKVSTGDGNLNSTNQCEVSLNVQARTVKGPCLFCEETGMVCPHAKSIILQIMQINSPERWLDVRYHVSSHIETCSATIPSMCLAGKLKPDTSFVPPDYKQPAGRPKVKRRDRAHLRKTNVQRTCKACGGKGHFASTCTKPSTECRFGQFQEKAQKWCEKQQGSDQ